MDVKMGLGGVARIANLPENASDRCPVAFRNDNTALHQMRWFDLQVTAHKDHVISEGVFRIAARGDKVKEIALRGNHFAITGTDDCCAEDGLTL